MTTKTTNVLTFRSAEKKNLVELLKKRVEDLPLSLRSRNCLANARVEYIYQLIGKTEASLLRTPELGRKVLKEVKEVLAETNLSLGTSMTDALKIVLGLPLAGDEPSEIEHSPVALPSREELIARRDRLNWLIEHYDQAQSGLKAYTDPID